MRLKSYLAISLAKVTSQVPTLAAFHPESLCHPALLVGGGQLGSLRKRSPSPPMWTAAGWERNQLLHKHLCLASLQQVFHPCFCCSCHCYDISPHTSITTLKAMENSDCSTDPKCPSPWGFQMRQTIFKMEIPSTGCKETRYFGDAMIEHSRRHPVQSP